MNKNSRNTVKTTETTFAIIEFLQQREGASTAEIAEESNMAQSTVHKHLVTLYKHGYVVKTGEKYRIGLKFLDHGGYARETTEIFSVSKEPMIQLADETGEKIWLISEEHGLGVYLRSTTGEKAVETEGRVGFRQHLHKISAGKCILAHLSEEKVRKIIQEHGLPPATNSTITNSRVLLNELDEIQQRGFAFNEEEAIEGISSVGAPILNNGTVLGAISAGCPTLRFENENYREYLKRQVLETANTVELNLHFPQI